MAGRQDPLQQTEEMQEWPIPQIGISPITGIQGTPTWGALNKFDQASRWVIGDADLDELSNVLPQVGQLQMLPNKSATIATLPSPMIWQSAQVLNGNLYTYYLCQNGHLYQVSTSGTITDVYAAGIFTQSGTENSTINITGLTSTANMFVGMGVSGSGVQSGSKIASIVSSTAITLTLATTLTGTFTLTFTPPLLSTSPPCDITNWEGQDILICDPVAEVLYAWNGTTFTAALSNQPANYIAVFGNRVWLLFGLTITWTQGGTFNSLAGDSGSAQITDSGCTNAIIGGFAIQSALYLFGSNWIATITNLIDTGSPAVLTFQFTVISSQIGIISKWSVVALGNYIYFANAYGIWQMQGSSPVKLSAGFDGLFQKLNLANSSFAGAYGEVLATACCFWNVYYNGDSNMPAGYTVLGVTSSNQLFRINQGNILFISGLVSSAITNNIPEVWATDGTNIFLLFQDFSTAITANINTKIWDMGSKIQFKTYDYVFLFMVVSSAATITLSMIGFNGVQVGNSVSKSINPITGQWINAAGMLGQWENAASTLGSWVGSSATAFKTISFNLSDAGPQRMLGLNITFLGAGMVLHALVVGWKRDKTGRHTALTDL